MLYSQCIEEDEDGHRGIQYEDDKFSQPLEIKEELGMTNGIKVIRWEDEP